MAENDHAMFVGVVRGRGNLSHYTHTERGVAMSLFYSLFSVHVRMDGWRVREGETSKREPYLPRGKGKGERQ